MSLSCNRSRDGRRPAPRWQPASGRGCLGLSAIAVAGCQCLIGSLDARCPRLPHASLSRLPIETRAPATGNRCTMEYLPDWVLPGNGAAELFTWAARDAAAAGISGLLAPGFADYRRALQCWDAAWVETALALSWDNLSVAPPSARGCRRGFATHITPPGSFEPCLARSHAQSPCLSDLR